MLEGLLPSLTSCAGRVSFCTQISSPARAVVPVRLAAYVDSLSDLILSASQITLLAQDVLLVLLAVTLMLCEYRLSGAELVGKQ